MSKLFTLRQGSRKLRVNIAALPPAGRTHRRAIKPGNGPVTSSKGTLAALDAAQGRRRPETSCRTIHAEKDDKAAFHSMVLPFHTRWKISWHLLQSDQRLWTVHCHATVLRRWLYLWLHTAACTNQLPVMFQPQKIGLSMPIACHASYSWQSPRPMFVAAFSMPPLRRMSMFV